MVVIIAAIACGGDAVPEETTPQVVEVTKIVTEQVQVPVEVTRVVSEEVTVTETIIETVPVTRVITETVPVTRVVTETERVEVTRVVEVEPERERPELVFAGLSWQSALVQNGVARYIVENGYGYPTSEIEGDTVPLFQGLRRGDIDITMEIWLPNQIDAWTEAIKLGEVISVGKSLPDNWQSTFVVPGFLQDANPGLMSVEDLKTDEFKELFVEPDSGGKAVLIGCLAGWACRAVNEGQVEAYGLSDFVELRDPGSTGALNAAIEAAYLKEEPILFYYWGPTQLADSLDMRILDQPDPSQCADNDPKLGCEFPTAEILVAMNTETASVASDLIPFFRNWEWDLPQQSAAEGWYGDNKDDYDSDAEAREATAVWFLSNNDIWKDWVSEEVVANVEAALAQ
jgi:glycine betaine/proline transport system substrate-binding protein